MSHLDQERTCTACGQPFRLADHAVTGARAVAHQLDAGTLADEDAPDIVRTCPKCLGTERMNDTEAHAELFRLEHATKQARDLHISRDVKAFASGFAFMGMALLVGSLFAGVVRGHTVLTWSGTAVGAVLALTGVVIGAVAVVRVYGKRKSQL